MLLCKLQVKGHMVAIRLFSILIFLSTKHTHSHATVLDENKRHFFLENLLKCVKCVVKMNHI